MITPEVRKRWVEEDTGKLAPYAWPGGYPVVYLTSDGAMVCPECAMDEDVSDDIVAGDIFYEGPEEQCAGCYKMIASAYGDPDAPDSDA